MLNILDYTIIAVILISAFAGILRGFVREAISLLTWVIALCVGILYAEALAGHLEVIALPWLRTLLSFLFLVLIVLIIGGIINYAITNLIRATGFSPTDRMIGMLFGVARGIVIVALLVLFMGQLFSQSPLWEGSQLLAPFQRIADWIKVQIPPDLLSDVFHKMQPAGRFVWPSD